MRMSELAKPEPAANAPGDMLNFVKDITGLLKEVNQLVDKNPKLGGDAGVPAGMRKSDALAVARQQGAASMAGASPPMTSIDAARLESAIGNVFANMKPGIESNPLYRNATVLQFIGQFENDAGFRKELTAKIMESYSYSRPDEPKAVGKPLPAVNQQPAKVTAPQATEPPAPVAKQEGYGSLDEVLNDGNGGRDSENGNPMQSGHGEARGNGSDSDIQQRSGVYRGRKKGSPGGSHGGV